MEDPYSAAPLPMRPAWQDSGSCKGADPALFFPERGKLTGPAKQICATCPVIEECLNYALSEAIKFGIWGGKSERERRQLRRSFVRFVTCEICSAKFPYRHGAKTCGVECARIRKARLASQRTERWRERETA